MFFVTKKTYIYIKHILLSIFTAETDQVITSRINIVKKCQDGELKESNCQRKSLLTREWVLSDKSAWKAALSETIQSKTVNCYLKLKVSPCVTCETFFKVHFQSSEHNFLLFNSPCNHFCVSPFPFFPSFHPCMVPILSHSYSEHCTNGFLEEWKRTLSLPLLSTVLLGTNKSPGRGCL